MIIEAQRLKKRKKKEKRKNQKNKLGIILISAAGAIKVS